VAVAILVSISQAIIVVEFKPSIRPSIHLHVRNALLVMGALDFTSERDDGPCPNKKRDRINGCVYLDIASNLPVGSGAQGGALRGRDLGCPADLSDQGYQAEAMGGDSVASACEEFRSKAGAQMELESARAKLTCRFAERATG